MAQVKMHKYGVNSPCLDSFRGGANGAVFLGKGIDRIQSHTGPSSFFQSRKKKKATTPSPQGCLPAWLKPSCVTRPQGSHPDPIQHLGCGPHLPVSSSVSLSVIPAQAPLHPGPGLEAGAAGLSDGQALISSPFAASHQPPLYAFTRQLAALKVPGPGDSRIPSLQKAWRHASPSSAA